jgi:hypothetical protein
LTCIYHVAAICIASCGLLITSALQSSPSLSPGSSLSLSSLVSLFVSGLVGVFGWRGGIRFVRLESLLASLERARLVR